MFEGFGIDGVQRGEGERGSISGGFAETTVWSVVPGLLIEFFSSAEDRPVLAVVFRGRSHEAQGTMTMGVVVGVDEGRAHWRALSRLAKPSGGKGGGYLAVRHRAFAWGLSSLTCGRECEGQKPRARILACTCRLSRGYRWPRAERQEKLQRPGSLRGLCSRGEFGSALRSPWPRPRRRRSCG